jgi:hypothetical protein
VLLAADRDAERSRREVDGRDVAEDELGSEALRLLLKISIISGPRMPSGKPG